MGDKLDKLIKLWRIWDECEKLPFQPVPLVIAQHSTVYLSFRICIWWFFSSFINLSNFSPILHFSSFVLHIIQYSSCSWQKYFINASIPDCKNSILSIALVVSRINWLIQWNMADSRVLCTYLERMQSSRNFDHDSIPFYSRINWKKFTLRTSLFAGTH